MAKTNGRYEIITENLSSWERALRLFESTTGMTVSLYLADGKRVLGPYATTPMGEHLLGSGAFGSGGTAERAEVEELIPILTLKETRVKLFADALTILGIPIKVEREVVGVIYAGWVFDHFPDPIECDRLSKIFSLSSMNFWQLARMQAPVSPEKLKIYEEMLVLMVSTMSEQMVSVKELRTASRIKDELLALVSHELKTPLTSLLLRVQMLKSQKITPDKMPGFIKSMEASTLLQSQMVEDLLDAAKIITGKFSVQSDEIDLKRLISEAVDLLSLQSADKEIRIQFTDIGGDYRFKGDALRLKQAILNLLSNSVKFTPRGGHISISLTRNISNYFIKVTDDGEGIDAEFVKEIFERFSQERERVSSKAGLGLGLFIVKRIIELHGGTIEVHSPGKNKGTVFEILLPH